MLGTFGVAIPTLLTGFTVLASLEGAADCAVAGSVRLDHRPQLERTDGGRRNAGAVHADRRRLGRHDQCQLFDEHAGSQTQWVTGHFHLIFAGTTVIMYLAVAYHLWPKLTGRRLASRDGGVPAVAVDDRHAGPDHALARVGPARPAAPHLVHPLRFARWSTMGSHELAMIVGGAILLFSALLFVLNLLMSHAARKLDVVSDDDWAVAVYPR